MEMACDWRAKNSAFDFCFPKNEIPQIQTYFDPCRKPDILCDKFYNMRKKIYNIFMF